jgi:hypothetical protein
VDRGDAPAVPVLDPVGVAHDESAVVVPGHDDVTRADLGAVGEISCGVSGVAGEPVESGPLVELDDEAAGGCQQERVEPQSAVAHPGEVGLIGGGGRVADVNPSVVGVVAEAGRVTGPDGE